MFFKKPIKRQIKDFNRYFPKEYIQMTSKDKMLNIISY